MLVRNRILPVLFSLSYLLTITVSALFHNHGGAGENARSTAAGHRASCCGCESRQGDRPSPDVPAFQSSDSGDCGVCHFMAQQPAPVAEQPAPELETALEELAAPSPIHVAAGVFTAWRSRAPPSIV